LNKHDYYEKLVNSLKSAGFDSEPHREINYGLQFNVSIGRKKELIRIYESKKGIKVDLSQVKDAEALKIINDIINGGSGKVNDAEGPVIPKRAVNADSSGDPDKLIGTDESGKGDYFGPLVIAGVYVDPSTGPVLRELGVDDSKKLTDLKIGKLAAAIKDRNRRLCICCPGIRVRQF
jgi:ribonuclease HIII